jgi:hypothetical protein
MIIVDLACNFEALVVSTNTPLKKTCSVAGNSNTSGVESAYQEEGWVGIGCGVVG